MTKKTIKRILNILLLCIFMLAGTAALFSAGCASRTGGEAGAAPAAVYRDIPGITDEELAAIENLKASGGSLVFGALPSLDIFENGDGTYGGFATLLCDLFTELFEIPFIPQMHDWRPLLDGLDSFEIDFTASVNMPADMPCHFYHTSPVAGNQLSVFTHKSRSIESEYDLRGMKVGFYAGSYTEQIVRASFPAVDFESVAVETSSQMAQMLGSGAIDAFIADTADVFEFYSYQDIVAANSFPHIYVPVTISTANPGLEPVISAITKYLMLGGGRGEVSRLYNESEHSYASYAIWHALSPEERAYIDDLNSNGIKIPVGITSNRYPVAFYDFDNEEFAGIGPDVLGKISALTGIEFYIHNDETATWGELEGMLRTGEIKLLSQLIPNEPRREYAIWPETPYFTARYALLSGIDYPFLSIDQVPYVMVGFAANTAEETKFKEWFPDSTNFKAFAATPGVSGTDNGLDALEKGEIDLFFSLDYTMLYESNYRQSPNQKINILFDEPVEPVPFGLHIEEEILCSIISKAQRIINTDKIARGWTSRLYDPSVRIAEERTRLLSIFSMALLVLLVVITIMLVSSQRLKRKVENQALATSEANRNLQVLLDMAPTAIVISRRSDGSILYANRTGLDMFGCKSFDEDVKGRTSFDFMPQIQPDGTESAEAVNEFWKNDRGEAEFQFIKKTGEYFPAKLAYCKISYYGEAASLNVVEDMTAEKEYQQRLQNIVYKEQEANQLKSRFLATMSHEIRTPMNAIIGMTDIALREPSVETKNEHVKTIKQAGANLLALINDILDFSKIEAGKMEIIAADYSLAALLNDVISTVRMRITGKDIYFTAEVDSRIPRVLHGDEIRVRQAVLNILGNAVKYTEKGGVLFTVSMAEAARQLAAPQETGKSEIKLVFEVIDSGIGIKEEDIDKLFEDFTQLDVEKNRFIEGVGLGLAITHNIVGFMGGSIDVKSEYGKGSVFTITVPQEYETTQPLAHVDMPEDKTTLLYTHSDAYDASLAYTLDGLGVSYDTAEDLSAMVLKLESGRFKFLFISYILYDDNKLLLSRFAADIKIYVLTQFGDAVTGPGIEALNMPVYCCVIADVLNGVYEDSLRVTGSDDDVAFTAPDAKVLIVDDIYTNLVVAEGLLSPYNMHVELAKSGMAAVDAVKESEAAGDPFDIIFMDHKMPVMDGVETTAKIREMNITSAPIVALTANAVTGVMEMLMESGFNDFISKPIDTSRLAEILEKWIPAEKKLR